MQNVSLIFASLTSTACWATRGSPLLLSGTMKMQWDNDDDTKDGDDAPLVSRNKCASKIERGARREVGYVIYFKITQ